MSPPQSSQSPTLDDARDFTGHDALVNVFVTCQDLERDLERSRGDEAVNSFQASSLPTNRNRNLRSVFVSRQLSVFRGFFVMIQTRSVKMH